MSKQSPRDHIVGVAMEHGVTDNLTALLQVEQTVNERYGKGEATDRDIQYELLQYASRMSREALVRMWAQLSFLGVRERDL